MNKKYIICIHKYMENIYKYGWLLICFMHQINWCTTSCNISAYADLQAGGWKWRQRERERRKEREKV